jgi:hypothetical protein
MITKKILELALVCTRPCWDRPSPPLQPQNGSQRGKRKEEDGTRRPGKLYHPFISDRVDSKTPLSIYQAAATKKRKLAQADGAPRKEKYADRGFIPVPVDNDDDVDLSDEDVGMLEEFGGSMGFLTKLDKKGIMRCVGSGISRVIVPQFMQE